MMKISFLPKFLGSLYLFVLSCYFIYFFIIWYGFFNPTNIFDSIYKNQYNCVDFTKYYVSAKMIALGKGSHFFDFKQQEMVYRQVLESAKAVLYYIDYPPYSGVIFLPLLLVPFKYCYLLFVVASLLVFGATFYFQKKQFGVLNETNLAYFLLGFFATLPVMHCIYLGQTSLIITASVLLILNVIIFDQKYYYSFLNFLILLKPHYCIFLGLLTLAKKRFKLLLLLLVSVIVIFFVSIYACGFEITINYPKFVYTIHSASKNNANIPPNFAHESFIFSLRYFFKIVMPDNLAKIFTIGTYLIGMLGTFLVFARTNLNNKRAVYWSISIVVLIFLLTSLHTLMQDLVLLAIPGLLTIKSLDLFKILKYDLSFKLWSMIFYFYPLISWGSFLLFYREDLLVYRQYTIVSVNIMLLCLAIIEYKKALKMS